MPFGWPWRRTLAASILLVAATGPSMAAAEVTPCGGIGLGGVTCPPPTSCNDDAECYGMGLGRCLRAGSGGGGVCSADCSALFVCTVPSDCPTFDGLSPACQPTAVPGATGLCTYHDGASRSLVTLCGTATGAVSLAQVRACFDGASWATGDCDGDTVLNGVDADPCSSSASGMVASGPSPFCLAGRICEGTSSTCAPLLRCSGGGSACSAVASRISARGPWECSPIPPATAFTFCHPSCDATLQCSGDTDCRGLGTCSTLGAPVAMCRATALAACASTCAFDPLDWASAQGDCDGDGAQNACDPNPCAAAGDPPCVFNHVCAVDAGTTTPDASVSTPDANVRTDGGVGADVGTVTPEDAALVPEDAASAPDASSTTDAASAPDATRPMDAATPPIDAGSVAMDASTTPQAMAGLGFGGGGGCRCALVGGPAQRGGGEVGLGLLALAALRRRRRATRR